MHIYVWKWSRSVTSNSLQPHGLWPTRLLSKEFSRQEYWSGLPFPSPGDLPNPVIEPSSPTLQADALPSMPPRSPLRELSPSTKFLLHVLRRELPRPVGWMELVNPILAGKTSVIHSTWFLTGFHLGMGQGRWQLHAVSIIGHYPHPVS